MTVLVVSCNILVLIYAKCQLEFLKTDHRWNLTRSQLEQEILCHENTIICLQELSLILLPELELSFFIHWNYTLFHNLYGGCHNGCMGISIAIPVSMELNSLSIIIIGDFIHSISKPRETQVNILTSECDMQEQQHDTPDSWETAIWLESILSSVYKLLLTINQFI
ncbi:unnamed protein product [Rotaria magnacalcarata]|uniref:Uncharacterized protein n=1 Tax=Rotaria magnacalcarata TaxID=392030 RepID=A0A819Y5N5_9BILA|nr:unnamed protein product [Rotaria magnacalcarata]CAF1629839.1 unnamed protein product [Rotaria magnacalcarata]CAF2064457.1 unnamed protein product [Rotaria magnacalcarata]CAF2066425.1 unnamed protein product [Rotaria magnacalcarata]CAF4154166.1 unnamed protein product [Rotaria magnacalcarata]